MSSKFNKSILAIVLLLFLFAIFSANTQAANDKTSMDVKSRISGGGNVPVIIVLKDQPSFKTVSKENTVSTLKSHASTSQKALSDLLDEEKGRGKADKIKRFWIINAIAVNASPELIEELSMRDDVASIELDSELHILEDYSVQVSQGQIDSATDAIKHINATNVWALGIDGSGVNVSIIDTGINASHPDIAGRVIKWVDFVNGLNNTPYDDHGHGTHVAGTVGGNGNRGTTTGVAPNVSLFGAKALDASGSGSESDVIYGIEWSVSNRANIISMSLGDNSSLWTSSNCDSHSPLMTNAINNALALNVTVIVAAGNAGSSGVSFPACISGTIAVGAVDSNDAIAPFSSTGFSMSDHGVVAPGKSILSLRSYPNNVGYIIYNDYYAYLSGTSMATPHVAGTVALLLHAANRQGTTLTPAQIKNIFNSTSIDLGTAGNDTTYGAGRINVSAAVLSIDIDGPNVIANPTGYTGGNTAAQNGTVITLNATITDAISGVKNASVNVSSINASLTDISLSNSSGFWTNNSVIVNASDGIYYLNVTAYDNLSNVNNTAQLTVIIDNNPPRITANPTGYAGGKTAAKNGENITLNATITDAISGVKNASVNVSSINASLTNVFLTNVSGFWTNSSVIVNATKGIYYLNITAYDNAGNANNTIQLSVTVANYSVNMTVDQPTRTTNVTVNATYTLNLQNNGTTTDTFNLTVASGGASTAALNVSGDITLESMATQTLLLNVTNTATGTFYVNVTARSNNDTTKFGYINTTTTVNNYSVNLTANTTAKSTAAGTNATYNLFLQNNGTAGDTYTLAVDNPNSAGTANLSIASPVFVSLGTTQAFTLNVTNTTSGTFRVNVTAMSTNDTSKLMYINTTTTVPIVIVITSPDNGSNTTNSYVNVTATLDANGTAKYLNWNGVNNTMTPNTSQPAGTVFFTNMTRLLSGNYSFKVYANDSNGVSNVSETRIITVNRTIVNTTIGSVINLSTFITNATLEIEAPSGNVTVTIPNNTNASVSGAALAYISTDSLAQVNSTFILGSSDDRWVGENLSLGPEGARFTPDIQIRFNYTDDEWQAAGITDESQLKVQFYNTSAAPNAWETPAQSQDKTLNYIIVNVSHFSTFALLGTVSSGSGGSSGGGGGGGGGGGPSGENYSNILVKENYDLYIAKDIVTSYAFTNKSNPVEFVNITGNTSAGIINVAVETLKNTSTLVNTSAPGITYKNVNIWVGTTGFAVPKNIKEATIVFKVGNSWLSSNNLKGSDVKLEKWDGSKWMQLETAQTTKDDTYTYYEGKTNSFSPFAISGLKSGVTVPTATPIVTETQPAQTAVPAATRKAAGFEAILVIATFLAIYVRLKRRE